MPRSSVSCLLPALVLAWSAAAPASAAPADATSVFVQAGTGEDSVHAVSVGVAWGLPWQDVERGLSTRIELFASDWRPPAADGGRRLLVQVGVVPLLRLRPDGGRSPWFIDAGIGISLLDVALDMQHRVFSTRLNFSDNLGIGRSFGARGEHEVSLQLQHTSNGGIHKPNPGLDLLMLRYAHAL